MAVLCLGFGCSTPKPDQSAIDEARAAKLLERRFRLMASQLEIGQTQSQVTDLLGPPYRTEVRTAGASLGTPWVATIWEYRNQGQRLWVTFEQGKDGWVVNNWIWN